ncbi:ATP-binding protein [Actinoplanes sp. NPDC051411]|uniref:ATP-binding protein n=1 Tax=Actinoplanes sp. NPDC051411 TaxID=3155522 RepID=UPI00343310C5
MNHEDFIGRVAIQAGTAVSVVERVFADHGFAPAVSSDIPRPIRLLRLRMAGDRSVEPRGSFDSEIRFGTGLTVLAADNLRGKTSVFELLTWCLRGSPRSNLQGVVRNWLSRLECDAVVAGHALGFRLAIRGGELITGVVLSAADPAQLDSAQSADPGRGIVEIARGAGQDEFATMVESLMMELLGLQRLESRSRRSASGTNTYGWAAYFGAIYLPSGGEPALLGDTVVGGLAGRLLQVFLDLPSAALLTRVKAARDQHVEAERAAASDAARVRHMLDDQRGAAQRELAEARAALAALPEQIEATALVTIVGELTDAAVRAEADSWQARETYELFRAQRRSDERVLNDLREHLAARELFHALDPQVCPRCEAPIGPERRAAERAWAICAVCASPTIRSDSHDQAIEEEARWRLSAAQAAEQLARKHRDEAASAADERRRALADAERALAAVRSGESERQRRELTYRLARVDGALAAFDLVPAGERAARSDTRVVLDAAVEVLTDDQVAAGDGLFDEMNENIAVLARSFGFRNLDRVVADRAGRLQIYKTGGPREWFTTQSPGERLRLRIAVVVALLRIGHRHGIATHPGLLLIDSPRSEEVQDGDAAALLLALERLCAETPALQILVTTADEELVRRTLTQATVVAPPGRGQPLW